MARGIYWCGSSSRPTLIPKERHATPSDCGLLPIVAIRFVCFSYAGHQQLCAFQYEWLRIRQRKRLEQAAAMQPAAKPRAARSSLAITPR